MFSIGSVLDEYLLKKKKLKKWYLIMLHYKEIVGETIAKNTRIVKINDQKLIISCRNSIWKRELELFKNVILERLQPYIKQDDIKEIVLIIGNVDLPQRKKQTKPAVLTMEEENWIKRLLEKTHPSYQKAFESLVRSYKGRHYK